jgi:integrase
MLYKRGKNWWVRFTIRGREVRVTSGTDRKALAEEFERRLRDQIYREIDLGEVRHSWEEAKERWLKEKAHKRSLARDRQAFAALDHYLQGKAIVEVDTETLGQIRERIAQGRAPGTVNRLMAVLRGVLGACVKWGWLNAAPKIENAYVEKGSPSWITQEQYEKLRLELPEHARAIADFAVAVGSRSRNVFQLRWDQVDLDRGIFCVDAAEYKGRRAVGFPISEGGMAVLRRQKGRHPVYVFTDQLGRAPVRSLKTCWRNAIKRAGLPAFRFHDLRHTWAAWHKLAGTPPSALKELGGWSDIRMTDRYGHINPTDYAQYVDNRRTRNGTEGSGK